MKIQSVFLENGKIPVKYTCDSNNINPRIEINDIPKNTKSLALILHDPDASLPGGFTHWVMWNIPVTKNVIIDEDSYLGIQGKNGANKTGYTGPCPPTGTHRYFFIVYALDSELNISPESTKQILEKAIQGHVIEKQELIGLYSRS